MKRTKSAIVIGTGAGGAMMARELQKKYQVTILEAGAAFKPFSLPVDQIAKFRKTGLFFDERLIRLFIPNMVIRPSTDMIMVNGEGLGGTTTLATGNAVRYDGALKAIGINLDEEYERLYQELPITTAHQKRWTKTTKRMFSLFEEMGLNPVVTPKFLCAEDCIGCGHCAIGCPTGAKWDTRALVEEAVAAGAHLITNCRVMDLLIENGSVTAVHAKYNGKKISLHADVIVLAAGGFGTPDILEKSGIPCEKTLFVDPVMCVAGHLPGIGQDKQILMPFISQQDGYILSPYMDYLSFFFHKKWRYPMKDVVSMMVKMADDEQGSVEGRKIHKKMTANDMRRMKKGIVQCREILKRLGVEKDQQFLGLLNAGHPGGMLPLTTAEKDTLHNPGLPENLYVADATILPESMGNPPILTIMALAMKMAVYL